MNAAVSFANFAALQADVLCFHREYERRHTKDRPERKGLPLVRTKSACEAGMVHEILPWDLLNRLEAMELHIFEYETCAGKIRVGVDMNNHLDGPAKLHLVRNREKLSVWITSRA